MSKKLFHTAPVLALAAALLTLFALRVSGEHQTKAPPKLSENEFFLNNIRSVSRILQAEGVEIEAELLFTLNGRKKLRPVLMGFTDMQMSKAASKSLRGVVMAGAGLWVYKDFKPGVADKSGARGEWLCASGQLWLSIPSHG